MKHVTLAKIKNIHHFRVIRVTFVSTCIVITLQLLPVTPTDVPPLSKLARCLWSACSFFYRSRCVGRRLQWKGKTELRGKGEECGGDATFKSPRS